MKTEDIGCGGLERRFRTILSEDVLDFLKKQNVKARQKILFNIRKAEVMTDLELFKKLTVAVWGFIKKQAKVPLKELEKAVSMRNEYLRTKNQK